jgi:hypothetical protein
LHQSSLYLDSEVDPKSPTFHTAIRWQPFDSEKVKYLLTILILTITISCENRESKIDTANSDHNLQTENSVNENKQTKVLMKPKVLILPSYDKIANRGISPNIRQFLQDGLKTSDSIELIEFPFNELMNIPYQNVFDKAYCSPILEKINCDLIVMSKIDLIEQTGNMNSDKWNLRIRIYNSGQDQQIDSSVELDGLTSLELKEKLIFNNDELVKEILKTIANN